MKKIEDLTGFQWRTLRYTLLAAVLVPIAAFESPGAALVTAITLTVMWAWPMLAVLGLVALDELSRLRR